MAKILVADDNSNVQKTVSLALEDLGVEVVAVNNGEAAVRKISEIAPDMILADIFMPVRNGYEVCEYVKKNPRYAHMPVVLLVGAFDPLDERESQRVGADGILKKPFVPPDPLVAMVKLMLERIESERPVMASVARSPQTANAQSSSDNGAEPEVASASRTDTAEPPEEPEEFTIAPRPVAFDDGEAPLAFGDLLNDPVEPSQPAIEKGATAVEDEAPISQQDVSLGKPASWDNDSEATEHEGHSSSMHSDAQQAPAAEGPEASSAPAGTTEDNSLSQIPEVPLEVPKTSAPPDPLQEEPIPLGVVRERTAPPETVPEEPVPLELVHEEKEQEDTPSIVSEENAIVLDPADQSPLTVEPGQAPDLAANPLEWMATAPAIPTAQESEPVAAKEHNEPLNGEPPALEEPAGAVPPVVPAPDPQSPVSAQEQAATVEESPVPSEVAADSKTPKETTIQPSPVPPVEQEASSMAAPETPEASAPTTAPTEQSPDATALAPEAAVSAPSESPALSSASASTDAAAPLQSKADPALVEAVVQRVLDKMRPQVVDIITKEFLRPVVQVLVRREIEKT